MNSILETVCNHVEQTLRYVFCSDVQINPVKVSVHISWHWCNICLTQHGSKCTFYSSLSFFLALMGQKLKLD